MPLEAIFRLLDFLLPRVDALVRKEYVPVARVAVLLDQSYLSLPS